MKRSILNFDFIKRVVTGLIMGIASVTPGLSAGVLAASAGLYEPAVHAIVSLRREFLKSVAFLLPLFIGAGVGVLLFSKLMKGLMATAEYSVIYVFFGLVVGSVPSLLKEANGEGFKPKYLWAALIALAVVVGSGLLMSGERMNLAPTPANLIIGGAVLAVGTVIPGISSSFVLMYLGLYNGFLAAIADLQFGSLALIGVGFLAAAALMVKVAEIVFKRFHGFSYYAVLGFLLGSMALMFPGLRSGMGLALDAVLFLAAAALSFFAMRMSFKS